MTVADCRHLSLQMVVLFVFWGPRWVSVSRLVYGCSPLQSGGLGSKTSELGQKQRLFLEEPLPRTEKLRCCNISLEAAGCTAAGCSFSPVGWGSCSVSSRLRARGSDRRLFYPHTLPHGTKWTIEKR